MKPIAFFLSIFTILTIAACKKADLIATTKKTSIVSNATLPGKWKVAGNWMSSGGPMYFVPATGDDHVQFNSDGTMAGSAFPDFRNYAIKDSVTIKMTGADNTTYENYIYRIKGDTLTLGMAGPVMCIEGCAVTLVKE